MNKLFPIVLALLFFGCTKEGSVTKEIIAKESATKEPITKEGWSYIEINELTDLCQSIGFTSRCKCFANFWSQEFTYDEWSNISKVGYDNLSDEMRVRYDTAYDEASE